MPRQQVLGRDVVASSRQVQDQQAAGAARVRDPTTEAHQHLR